MLLSGVYFYNQYFLKKTQTDEMNTFITFNKKLKEANITSRAGDVDSAINDYYSLLKSTPDKGKEGELRVLIAGNLLIRNHEGDLATAVSLYKQVISDYSLPPYARALAYNDLAHLLRDKDRSFYQLYFPEPPFSEYLAAVPDSSSAILELYFKFIQLANETLPNSYAEYAIAGDYYAPKITGNKFQGPDAKEMAEKIQSHIEKGDMLGDSNFFAPNILLRGYLFRAIGLGVSDRVLKNVGEEKKEEAYKLIFEKAEKYAVADDQASLKVLMRARFFYATFLINVFGESRVKDIEVILNPLFTLSPESNAYKATQALFQIILGYPTDNQVKINTLKLAEVSPGFKMFLVGAGWKF